MCIRDSLNTEVHDFEPSAKDMADLSKAKVLFLSGADLESWKDKVEEVSKIEMVDTSKGIDLIKAEDEEDEHEDSEKEEDHDHEDGEEEHHHHHGLYDPHVWLSPKNGIIQAKNIAEKLSEMDPKNKDCLLYTSPSPRDRTRSRMPSSA